MRSRILAIGLVLLPTLAVSVPARAQSASGAGYAPACAAADVPHAKSEEAHAFYDAGRVVYNEGNYESAIAQFREAYKRDCSKHDILVIISRAYELKGDRAEAVRALELFLERAKDSPDAGTHRTRIDNLKRQMAAQPPSPSPSPPPPVAPPSPPQAQVREHTILPWVLVGAGGLAVAVGIVVAVTAPSLPGGCRVDTQDCKPQLAGESDADYKDRASRAGASQDQPGYGYITVGGGLALVAGGLLWHFLEPTGPVSSTASIKPTITPAVAPGYAGVSLGGRF